MTSLRTNYILPKSKANGPGIRFTVWVQGCSIHCPGCNNTDTWDPAGGREILIPDLIAQINKVEAPLHGVTITGGEPLDQFEAVYDLCSKLFGKISIFLTTGYDLKDLTQRKYLKILDVLDIICIGPFDKEAICKNQWRGSSNQDIIYLTELGCEQSCMPIISKEVHIDVEGNSLITGFTK